MRELKRSGSCAFRISSANLLCTACGSTSNRHALLWTQCPGTTQEGRSHQLLTVCQPLPTTIVHNPRRLNPSRYRQPTPKPCNDGRPSFVSIDTCRAAKSETAAAAFDALGTRTICAMTGWARTTISSVYTPCRRCPAWTLLLPKNFFVDGCIEVCCLCVHLLELDALSHPHASTVLNVDTLTVGVYVSW